MYFFFKFQSFSTLKFLGVVFSCYCHCSWTRIPKANDTFAAEVFFYAFRSIQWQLS